MEELIGKGQVQTPNQNKKVYLDTCCLSRLADVQTQEKVRHETAAIVAILDCFFAGTWSWVVSTVLKVEVNRNPNLTQRDDINALVQRAHHVVKTNRALRSRGKQLESLGFKTYDALHIACAENSEVDVFLTTDERMLKKAKSVGNQLRVRVENPYIWLQEVQR